MVYQLAGDSLAAAFFMFFFCCGALVMEIQQTRCKEQCDKSSPTSKYSIVFRVFYINHPLIVFEEIAKSF
jgi:hypothetical protein